MTIIPLRSVLFLPSSNERAIEKATSLSSDAIIFDLEDAVSEEAKQSARKNACTAVQSGNYANKFLIIRTNGAQSLHFSDDLEAALSARPDAILLPKVDKASDLHSIIERLNGIALWAMIESSRGILNAAEIAGALSNIPNAALVIGPNDIARETTMRVLPDRSNLIPALTQCVFAARAAGIKVLDGVYNNFRDEAGFAVECLQGRDLGMDGKTLIHPNQIAPANDAFCPSAEEIASAKTIVDVFELPENRQANVVNIDGRMVERLHGEMAKATLDFARAIGKDV